MDLPLILDIVSTAALTIGIVFGLFQLRQYHSARKRESALLLLNSSQTDEFLRGILTIWSIPDGLTKKEIEEAAGDEIGLVYLVLSTWENIGILVFRKEVTLDMVDDAYSGPLAISWHKLEPYVSGLREELQRETMFEWFQWLAERMRDREKSRSPVPAHIAYEEWDG
jgi:hypothetical protein